LCERLHCRTVAAADMDPDYFRVSDHCPVIVDGSL
jgi:exonuclease III